eukprot:6959878-Prymnesium_polylepis.1
MRKLGDAVLATAFAAGDTLAIAYTSSLDASSPIGWLVRADRGAGQLACAAQLQLHLWWVAFWPWALPKLLRAKAFFIREEGVWF